MNDLFETMLVLRTAVLSSAGQEPTAFLLGIRKFLQFKQDAESKAGFSTVGKQTYTFLGIEILVVDGDPDYVGITVPPEVALSLYSREELESHPNGRSGAW